MISSGSCYPRENVHLNLAAKIGSKTWHYDSPKYLEYFSPKELANEAVCFVH